MGKTGKEAIGGVVRAPSDEGSRRPRLPWLSAGSLVGANLVPLLGVLLAGWRAFPIMLLFSLENIVIGFYNVLRMALAPCDLAELRRTSQGIRTKAGLIAFFCVHYSGFAFGHLFFIVMLFGVGFAGDGLGVKVSSGPAGQGQAPAFLEVLKEDWWGIAWAFAAMWVSHGVSYWQNFIRGREYLRVKANDLVLRPYGRVMAMHVAIIAGAFAVVATGNRAAPLALLVVGKIIVDLAGHLAERRKFRKPRPAS